MNLIFTVQWVPVGQLVELGSDTTVPGLSTQTNNLMYWKSVWVKMPAEWINVSEMEWSRLQVGADADSSVTLWLTYISPLYTLSELFLSADRLNLNSVRSLCCFFSTLHRSFSYWVAQRLPLLSKTCRSAVQIPSTDLRECWRRGGWVAPVQVTPEVDCKYSHFLSFWTLFIQESRLDFTWLAFWSNPSNLKLTVACVNVKQVETLAVLSVKGILFEAV